MANESMVQEWYDFSLQQMVAESYLDGINVKEEAVVFPRLKFGNNDLRPIVRVNGQTALNQLRLRLPDADENTPILPGATRLTDSQADYFFRNWQIIDQKPSDASGFSATLLQKRGTNEFTFAIRGTEIKKQEFGGDSQRDIGSIKIGLSPTATAGADVEIGWYGLAMGQIDSMERYYKRLRDDGLLPANAVLNVTGFSLGGHLATEFAELHASEINHAYVFNAAGRGNLLDGWNVGSLLNAYRALLADPGAYPLPSAIIQYTEAQVLGLRDAAIRDQRALSEQPNLYSMPRHRWAMFVLDQFMNGTAVTTALGPADIIDPNADAKITYLYGMGSHNDDTGTARSGVTPSDQHIVFIEDQPNFYGAGGLLPDWILPDSAPSWLKGDLLRTHSITLLADSLALMSLFQKFDPALEQLEIETILAGASNRRAESKLLFNATAESDSLENGLDALWKIFKDGSKTPVNDSPEGFGDLANREVFYNRISQLEEVAQAAGEGAFSILPLASMTWEQAGLLPGRLRTFETRAGPIDVGEIISEAEDDGDAGLAYRYALAELNPFVVIGLQYEEFNENGELDLYDPDSGTGTITPEWLSDRARLLAWRLERNVDDANTNLVRASRGEASDFTVITDDGTRDLLRVAGLAVEVPEQTSQIVFGGNANDRIDGFDREDGLYGGAGDDVIAGRGRNDYLQGDAGADQLDGGDGADTLFGGGGDDTLAGGLGNDALEGGLGYDRYVYRTGEGFDTVFDVDGSGGVVFDGAALTGGAKDADGLYWNADHTVYFALLGDPSGAATLDVNGRIEITGFHDGDLGISLAGAGASEHLPPAAGGGWFYDDYPIANQEGGRDPYDPVDPPLNAWGSPNEDTYVAGDEWGPYFLGKEGNDFIQGGGHVQGLPAALLGGRDDDYIVNEPVTNDSEDPLTEPHLIAGEAGSDFIQGSSDAEALFGDFYRLRMFTGPTGDFVLDVGVFRYWSRNVAPGEPGGRDILSYSPPSVMGSQFFYDSFPRFEVEPIELAEVIERLVGDPGPGNFDDYLDAGGGDDYLVGGSGSDVLLGGEGNDRLYGDGVKGAAVPYYDFVLSDDQDLIAAFGAPGNDILDGGEGDDVLVDVGGETGFAFGGDGDDDITVRVGFFDPLPEDDDLGNTRGLAVVDGGPGNDVIEASAPDVQISGGEGNDSIVALDVLFAAQIDGGPGDDTIEYLGSLGFLRGGSGADLYRVDNFPAGTVFIRDEGGSPGETDRLQLSGAPGDYLVTRDGSDLVFEVDPALLLADFGGAEFAGLSVTIEDWFVSERFRIEQIGFDSADMWSADDAAGVADRFSLAIAALESDEIDDPFAPEDPGAFGLAPDEVAFSEPPAESATGGSEAQTHGSETTAAAEPSSSSGPDAAPSAEPTGIAAPLAESNSGESANSSSTAATETVLPSAIESAASITGTAATAPGPVLSDGAAAATSTVSPTHEITGTGPRSDTNSAPPSPARNGPIVDSASSIVASLLLPSISPPSRASVAADTTGALPVTESADARRNSETFFSRIASPALGSQTWLNEAVTAGARPQRSETEDRRPPDSAGSAAPAPSNINQENPPPADSAEQTLSPDEIAQSWDRMHAWHEANSGFDDDFAANVFGFSFDNPFGAGIAGGSSIAGPMGIGRTLGLPDLSAGSLKPLQGLKEGFTSLG